MGDDMRTCCIIGTELPTMRADAERAAMESMMIDCHTRERSEGVSAK
eukprot:CAMPEP_0115889144 /NCGR_PEP_ID=MMETSP0287-20121206/32675_1 /TAXON_ID=412157 /ORGANISM="Chrysochromulina rotalis, Strain UIO044" /LENGTH=46 /DNA_ID= /DNA_START= /DNA_END= /DNA_ORIENTATION=